MARVTTLNEYIGELNKRAEASNRLTAGLGYGLMLVLVTRTMELAPPWALRVAIPLYSVSVIGFFVVQIAQSLAVHEQLVRAVNEIEHGPKPLPDAEILRRIVDLENRLRREASVASRQRIWLAVQRATILTGIGSALVWTVGLAWGVA